MIDPDMGGLPVPLGVAGDGRGDYRGAEMVAGVVLVQFPDLSLPAVCGIGSMLGIAGYQVIEIAIQRRFKGRGKQ